MSRNHATSPEPIVTAPAHSHLRTFDTTTSQSPGGMSARRGCSLPPARPGATPPSAGAGLSITEGSL